MTPNIALVKTYLLGLQDTVSTLMQDLDPQVTVQEDNWSRTEGGGGRTRAFSNGQVIEKAGVNFSHIWGSALPHTATIRYPELQNTPFQVVGLSLIIHPLNPFVPTCHANLRFFTATPQQGKTVWWFGGGFDLTPYYGFEEDCIHWHVTAKKACDPFGLELYPRFKAWADHYFFIKHRNEPRGIGGIFFDDLNLADFATSLAFIQSIGDHFLTAYFPIVKRRALLPYDAAHRNFQCFRRGRYVEFNLVYDRGTLFGLQLGGRIESILISLPPIVSWQYNWQPAVGTPEAELYDNYLQPQDWANKTA